MTRSTEGAVLGLDVGGTSTRAMLLDAAGNRVGQGTAGGGNLSSHDRDEALNAIFFAIEAALTGHDPAAVTHAVIGIAGAGHFRRSDVADDLARRWAQAGLTSPYEIESDAVVAFVAGTDQPDGTLVLSGTGALATSMVDRAMARTIDGHGWLVGDRGSAFWLGREAVAHALETFDVGLEPSSLALAVAAHYEIDLALHRGPRDVQSEIEVAVYRDAPVKLATLAPTVTALVDDDPAAARIVAAAADHLLRAASLVRTDDDTTSIVLAGSLLVTDTPLASSVRERLAESWPRAPIAAARSGAAAAAWLALVRGDVIDADVASETHRRAVGPKE